MVVDYRLLNKVYLMHSLGLVFKMRSLIFKDLKCFVLDLNSAYHQIPLSGKSGKATAFCTPECINFT
jgi:hypothetical protein